eukprot:SAG31_NODE_3727_length_3946_cov_2.007798_5_plen_273_part_00
MHADAPSRIQNRDTRSIGNCREFAVPNLSPEQRRVRRPDAWAKGDFGGTVAPVRARGVRPCGSTATARHQLLGASDIVKHFNAFGFTRPITVLSGARLAAVQATFSTYSRQARQAAQWRDPRHWLDIVGHPGMLAIAQALTGSPNLVCHVSQFIDKSLSTTDAMGGATVFGNSAKVFHQDASFNAMETGSVVLWLALADADESNGCMLCLPRSHLHGIFPCTEDRSKGGIDGGGHSVDLTVLPSELSLSTVPPYPIDFFRWYHLYPIDFFRW